MWEQIQAYLLGKPHDIELPAESGKRDKRLPKETPYETLMRSLATAKKLKKDLIK